MIPAGTGKCSRRFELELIISVRSLKNQLVSGVIDIDHIPEISIRRTVPFGEDRIVRRSGVTVEPARKSKAFALIHVQRASIGYRDIVIRTIEIHRTADLPSRPRRAVRQRSCIPVGTTVSSTGTGIIIKREVPG